MSCPEEDEESESERAKTMPRRQERRAMPERDFDW